MDIEKLEMQNKGVRTALVVTGCRPAVKERAGSTPSRTDQTFLCLTLKSNGTKFTLQGCRPPRTAGFSS